MPKYCVNKDGYKYVYTKALAARTDMRVVEERDQTPSLVQNHTPLDTSVPDFIAGETPVSVFTMNKEDLIEYAKTLGLRLNRKKSVEVLRQEVITALGADNDPEGSDDVEDFG